MVQGSESSQEASAGRAMLVQVDFSSEQPESDALEAGVRVRRRWWGTDPFSTVVMSQVWEGSWLQQAPAAPWRIRRSSTKRLRCGST
jgi:hypothetical protein